MLFGQRLANCQQFLFLCGERFACRAILLRELGADLLKRAPLFLGRQGGGQFDAELFVGKPKLERLAMDAADLFVSLLEDHPSPIHALRPALDRIITAGGFISVNTGSAQDANAILVKKSDSDRAMDAAACIGCGACVAACPNASAALFTGAKISHLGLLPQGQPERPLRALAMSAQAAEEGFGHCTTIGECEANCPANIKLEVIARMNGDYIMAKCRNQKPAANE